MAHAHVAGPISQRARNFCAFYVVHLDPTQAAKEAGYSPRTAKFQGRRLMDDPAIQAEISRQQRSLAHRTCISQERVLRELARVAFFDVRSVVTWEDGALRLRDSAEIADDDAAAISEIVVQYARKGLNVRVKAHNKLPALFKIGEHLGIFKAADLHFTQVNIFPAQDELEAKLYDDLDAMATALTAGDESC